MKKVISFFLAAVICILSGCSSTVIKNNEKIMVCTSFSAMQDFTKQIAGDCAEVVNLMPPGTEPHEWEPSAGDILMLEKAGVFIYSGHGMEHWVDKVKESLSNKNLIIVEAAEGISGGGDPHVWLDPINAKKQMKTISDALCAADSENSEYYMHNYNVCAQKLDELDTEYKNADLSGKNIIVGHEAYGYLCKRYGLTQTAAEGLTGESDPSPAKMAELASFARQNGIRYVFAENKENTKTLDTLAREIGGDVLILDPFETSEKDYFTVMEENLSALKKSLGD